jgi:hypothetical protein
MKRAMLATLAAMAMLSAATTSAHAAVSFGFVEAAHHPSALPPGTFNRGDEFVAYSVKLKNTGTTKSSVGTNVSISVPPGLRMAPGGNENWVCQPAAQTCTSTKEIDPGVEFPPLEIGFWILPQVPDVVSVDFLAYGGGAPVDAFANDTFTLGSATPFGMKSLVAGACSAPVGGTLARSCPEAEELSATPYTKAGGHPFAASSSFELNQRIDAEGDANVVEGLRDLFTDLPAGFVGNPESLSAPPCTAADIRETKSSALRCPESAAVGGASVSLKGIPAIEHMPIYRIVPEEGYAAAFAFRPSDGAGDFTVVLRAKVRSNGDYGVTAIAPWPPEKPVLMGVRYVTLCGYGAKLSLNSVLPTFAGCKHPGTSGANSRPFLTNQTRCVGGEPVTRMTLDSYQRQGAVDSEGRPVLTDLNWKVSEASSPAITECAALTESWVGAGPEPHRPSFQFVADTSEAAAAAGYRAHLHVPQEGLVDRNGTGTAHLKKTVVKLPSDLVLNPASANGLGVCTEAQIGYLGNSFPAPNPTHFNTTSEGCPDNSKLGTVEVTTPLLAKSLRGGIYLAAQRENPFGSDFAVYLVIDDPETGVVAKLPGLIDPNQTNGQITATFDNNPQVPVEDLTVDFMKGPRASLINPDVCSTYTTRTELVPWSAADPDHPTEAETAVSESPTVVTPQTGKSSCPSSKGDRPFGPGVSAGVKNAAAGANTAFSLRLTRSQGDQELSKITVSTPPGLVGSLRGVGVCSQDGINRAAARSKSGEGALEMRDPSCPSSSQVGTTTIGVGTGNIDGPADNAPFYVKTGKVYLTGPYNGAPLGLVFVVPAVAGPFDLGVQVVRTALRVDPKTAAITAESDPLPQILAGVPLQVRDVRVDLDRSGFVRNPTNCQEMSISTKVSGVNGASVNRSNRFQVGNCGALGFSPNLRIELHGGTKRAAYQRLVATVTANPGDANISRAAVTLPHSAFLAQEHIRTVCTRVQFAARACPPGSIYGHATAITPLLDEPLTGPVYLRSSNNKLPDLVAALRGPDAQPIEVELSGRTDSKNGGIRNTFDLVPDAPVSRFTLQLMGGKKSLIVNSRDLCKAKKKQRATVRLSAQNGRRKNFRPVVANDCGKKKRRNHGHRRNR